MRTRDYFLAAALVAGVTGTALAQTSTPGATPAPPLAPTNNVGFAHTHWLASGSVGANLGNGSNFDTDASRSWEFGGQAAYLWRGVVGGEFLASFTPSYKFDTPNFNIDDPDVTSYMANLIGVLPLGANAQWQPYVSGGFGGLDLSISNVTVGNTTVSSNHGGWGSNVGGGLMAFVGRSNWGIRADARYYNSMSSSSVTASNAATEVTRELLSDLNFWRTNIGLAYQW